MDISQSVSPATLIRNRASKSTNRTIWSNSTEVVEPLMQDHIELHPPVNVEHLTRHILAYISLYPPGSTRLYAGDFLNKMCSADKNIRLLKGTYDGLKPVARLPLPGGDAYIALRNTGVPGGFDVTVYSAKDSDEPIADRMPHSDDLAALQACLEGPIKGMFRSYTRHHPDQVSSNDPDSIVLVKQYDDSLIEADKKRQDFFERFNHYWKPREEA